jgi:membrane-anchored mycosin MYCP
MTTDGTVAEPGRDNSLQAFGEVVVDSDHASLVVDLVPGMANITDTIPALSLSLLAFPDVQGAIDELRDRKPVYELGDSSDLVDRLILALRSAAAGQWSGWYPTMGKNRFVMGPEAEPYTSPRDDPDLGPEPDPEPAALVQGLSLDDGRGVVVGVLDTAAIPHPFYKDSVSFIGNSETSSREVREAFQAHGTFVTGLVHANAPGAKILVRAPLSRDKGLATAWEAAKGLVDLVEAGADVVNMSIGCITIDNRPPFALQAAVERLRDRALFVAAAGNYDQKQDGPTSTPPSWPAALDGVLAVGSEDREGVASPFSPQQPWVDVVAIGRDLVSTFAEDDQTVSYPLPNGGTATPSFCGSAKWSGTSFAAAVVAGHIATLASRSGYPDEGTSPTALGEEFREGKHAQDGVIRCFVPPAPTAAAAGASAPGASANP